MNTAPDDTTATRGRHFSEIVHGRAFAYGIAIGVLVVVAAAILLDQMLVFAGAPMAVLIVIAIAFARAGAMAETDFFKAFAAAHDFSHYPEYNAVAYTPLLGAGDRRHCSNYMEGPLAAGDNHSCALSQYTFEVKHQRTDSEGRTTTDWKSFDWTVCVVDLGSSAPQLPGIYLTKRLRFLSILDGGDWLDGFGLREDQMESSEFTERFELLVEPTQDEVTLRQLFTPSLIQWLATNPLQIYFEYQAGMLVVYMKDHLDDAAHLQRLLEATRELARRFGEHANLRSAA